MNRPKRRQPDQRTEPCAASFSKAGKGIPEWLPSRYCPAWLYGVCLAVVTIVAYQPAWHGAFIWDDVDYVSNNDALHSLDGLRRIWFEPGATIQYYPLAFTSYWMEYHLWGADPLGYHLVNISLHALNAILLWLILQRLNVPAAWLAAGIFALHPICVESVAWVAERKNTLSLVFYFGALLAYGRFMHFWVQGDGQHAPVVDNSQRRRWGAYGLALLLFLCALSAKTTAFSLPAVILLICWWKQGRIRWRADVLPTLPCFVLAIGFSSLTSWLEKYHVGARGMDWNYSFSERCLIGGRALWFYVGNLLWPMNLCFDYPLWHLDARSLGQWLYPVAAIGVFIVFWLARTRIGRGPIVAALFFVGTLFPVLGFMNVYYMRYSFVCDHWVYLSSLGLIVMGTALVAQVARRLRAPGVLFGVATVVLPVLAILTWRQSKMYTDSQTLWQMTIARCPDAWLAHENFAGKILESGQLDKAIAHFQKSLEIQPRNAFAHNGLGMAFIKSGRVDEALTQFEKAVGDMPDYVDAQNNLAVLLLNKGQWDKAIDHFKKVLEIRPNDAIVQGNLGNALFMKGQADEAIAYYKTSLAIRPNDAIVQGNLGNALFRKRQLNEAVVHYRKALEINPDNTHLLNILARVLAASPDASIRNGAEAVELAQRADRLSGGKNPRIITTLAAADAEAGQFPEAVMTAQRALELAVAQTNAALVETLRLQIGLYRANLPFRDPSLTNAPSDQERSK